MTFHHTRFPKIQAALIRLLKPSLIAQKLTSGFTLIELLVAAAIGAIITSSLLWLVVQLVSSENTESALSTTDQEMQRALDYITADLKQAVYVYDGKCNEFDANSCPSYANYLPSNIKYASDTSTNPDTLNLPVLALWRTVPLADDELPSETSCDTPPTSITTSEGSVTLNAADQEVYASACDVMRRQRKAYSLVVYVQRVDDNNNWSGRSRIYRYELAKFQSGYEDVLDRTPGFVDPSEVLGLFPTWPLKSSTVNCQTDPAGCNIDFFDPDDDVSVSIASTSATGTLFPVLVDFVDCPDPSNTGICPDYAETVPTIPDADSTTSGTQPCPANYLPTPRDTTASEQNSLAALQSQSFFACVPDSNAATGENFSGDIQDVYVYLRGNAGNRKKSNGSVFAAESRLDQDSYTPLLQTRITLRGLIDWEPN